jgi:hypothetical protein
MSPTPRRSLRLAGKEPELTAATLPTSASASAKSSKTEWKGMSFHVPRMDNCLLFGKFLAAAVSTATVLATYTWKQS